MGLLRVKIYQHIHIYIDSQAHHISTYSHQVEYQVSDVSLYTLVGTGAWILKFWIKKNRYIWMISSIGRAPALHAGGFQFNSEIIL